MFEYLWILFLLAILVCNYVWYRVARLNPSGLEVIEAQFGSMRIDSDDPSARFAGRLATIVRDDRELTRYGVGMKVVGLNRICKNESGRYFLFIFTSEAPPFCLIYQ